VLRVAHADRVTDVPPLRRSADLPRARRATTSALVSPRLHALPPGQEPFSVSARVISSRDRVTGRGPEAQLGETSFAPPGRSSSGSGRGRRDVQVAGSGAAGQPASGGAGRRHGAASALVHRARV